MFILKFGKIAAGGLGVPFHPVRPALLFSIFLAGCATAPPVVIGNGNPANPAAERGYVEAPAALDSYKSAADLAAGSNGPAGTMEGTGHRGMPGMPGMKMDRGAMPGMSDGKTGGDREPAQGDEHE